MSTGKDSGLAPITSSLATNPSNKEARRNTSVTDVGGQQEPVENQHCQATANSTTDRQALSAPEERVRHNHSMLATPLSGAVSRDTMLC